MRSARGSGPVSKCWKSGASGRGKAYRDYSCDGAFGDGCDDETYGYDGTFGNTGDNHNGGTDDCDGGWSGLSI